MAAVALSVTTTALSAAIQAMAEELTDLTPIFKAIGSRLERNINMGFDTKTDTTGKLWASWSIDTAAERADEGRGSLLEYTGRMRDSLTFIADSSSVEVGFGVDYAKFHEQLNASSGKLPKRSMLFDDGQLSENYTADVLAAAMTALQKHLKL